MDRPSHEAPSPAPRSRVTASPLSRQPETSFDAAAALHRSGRLDAAAAAYRDILAREPANPTCLQLLGLLHLQQGELAEAAVRLGEAIACGLDTPEAHYHRGLVLDELQRPEEAILCYRAALAGALARRGRQDEALACRREAVRHRPTDAAARRRLGDALYRLGRSDEAIAAYRRAIALDPACAEAHNNLGVALNRAGEAEAAVASCRRAIAAKPDYAQAHNNLGLALGALGRHEEAIAAFRAAIARDPASVEAQVNLGNALQRLARHAESIACYEAALTRDPASVEAHSNLGAAYNSLGRPAEAIAPCRRALALRPDYIEALNNLGAALSALQQHDEAIAGFRRVIALAPGHAEAHNNLGVALTDTGRPVEAIACHRRAIALRPNDAEAHNNLGTALSALDRPDEAREAFATALRLRPGYAEALSNLGLLCAAENRHEDALAHYEAALQGRPDHPWVHFNKALSHLALGDLAAGWAEYEWRWRTSRFAQSARAIAAPLWRGEAIAGRTILLHCEQGLGDTLQFLRYLPLVAARGGRVVLEVQPPLKPLLDGITGAVQVAAAGEALPAFDLYCPLMSLPHAVGTTLATIPPPFDVTAGAATRRDAWQARLADLAPPRIGLVWAGSRSHKNDRRRSLPLAGLAPLLALQGLRFVSLQKALRAGDAELLRRLPAVTHLGDRLGDFADAAAAVAALDLVITVDTAIAHLAGSLGVPCWVMLPFAADWRWLLGRADSPWYPSLRLFRQPAPGAWDAVVAQIRDALVEAAAQGALPHG